MYYDLTLYYLFVVDETRKQKSQAVVKLTHSLFVTGQVC